MVWGRAQGPRKAFFTRERNCQRQWRPPKLARRPTSGPVGRRRTWRHVGLDQNSADGTSFSHASPRYTENSNWSLTGPAGSPPGLELGEQGLHCQRAGRQCTDGSGPAPRGRARWGTVTGRCQPGTVSQLCQVCTCQA